jgi:restriction endonuclease S subunit
MLGLVVEKEKIASTGEYNLNGERYRENGVRKSIFPLLRFEDVCTLEYGASLPKGKRIDGPFPVVGSNGITGFHNEYLIGGPAIIVGRKGSAGEVTLIEQNCFPIDTTYYIKQTDPNESDIVYLYWVLKSLGLPNLRGGAGIPGLNRTDVYQDRKIPLPPLPVQKEIVAEIEGYQKVINGARDVLDNYRPHSPIHPDWPEMELGEVCRFIDYRGKTPEKTTSGIQLITAKNVREGFIDPEPHEYISEANYDSWMTRGIPQVGDVLFTTEAPLGNIAQITLTGRFAIAQRLIALCPNRELLIGGFLKDVLLSKRMREIIFARQSGTTVYGIKASVLKEIKIPVPPIATQQAIVDEIETEQALVAGNRELVARFEKKIQITLSRVWGEDKLVQAEDS